MFNITYGRPGAYRLLPEAHDCLLPTAYSLLPENIIFDTYIYMIMSIAYCLLPMSVGVQHQKPKAHKNTRSNQPPIR